jgi:hypothetical protein
MPKKLEMGMLFIKVNEESILIYELDKIPLDEQSYIIENGAPVELCIIDENNNVLAEYNEIGWIDDGEHTDELRSITLEDINFIFNEYEGWLELEIIEDLYDVEGLIIPNFINEKIIISLISDEEEFE